MSDIKNIPIPKNINSKKKRYIINLARKIIKIKEEYSKDQSLNPVLLESKINTIQKEIDDELYKVYDLYND